MGRVIAEYEGAAESNNVSLTRTFVYGNGIDEVLAMFLPETTYDPNDGLSLADFCNSWLCDVNDSCYDSQYDYDSSNIINFKDFATFAANNEFSLPDLKETRWYYLHDALGSVAGVVGGRFGREADREFYLYDVYGRPQGSEQSPSGNPYGFQGKRFDSEVGLYFYEARYYDAELGRFISSDLLGIVPNAKKPNKFNPIIQYKDGLNLYQTFASNPVMYTDSYGLECCWYEKLRCSWQLVESIPAYYHCWVYGPPGGVTGTWPYHCWRVDEWARYKCVYGDKICKYRNESGSWTDEGSWYFTGIGMPSIIRFEPRDWPPDPYRRRRPID